MFRLSTKDRNASGPRTEKASRDMEYVRVGSTYRRIHPDNLVEKATVMNLADGPLGIPHVSFEVSFERANHAIVAGETRTLALRAFAERYAGAV